MFGHRSLALTLSLHQLHDTRHSLSCPDYYSRPSFDVHCLPFTNQRYYIVEWGPCGEREVEEEK